MRFSWNKWNSILFTASIILIVIGYAVMAGGDKTVSPIILMIAYLGLVPLSLVFTFRGKEPRE
jgi:hypothetical protein